MKLTYMKELDAMGAEEPEFQIESHSILFEGLCSQCLKTAAEHVSRALLLIDCDPMPELVAEELRLASRALGEILGETTTEDILGMIFSKFCIGK